MGFHWSERIFTSLIATVWERPAQISSDLCVQKSDRFLQADELQQNEMEQTHQLMDNGARSLSSNQRSAVKVTYPSQYYRSAFTELSRAVSSFNSTDFCRAITTLSESVPFSEGEISAIPKGKAVQTLRSAAQLLPHRLHTAWPHWMQDSAYQLGLPCLANVVQRTANGKQSCPLHVLCCAVDAEKWTYKIRSLSTKFPLVLFSFIERKLSLEKGEIMFKYWFNIENNEMVIHFQKQS